MKIKKDSWHWKLYSKIHQAGEMPKDACDYLLFLLQTLLLFFITSLISGVVITSLLLIIDNDHLQISRDEGWIKSIMIVMCVGLVANVLFFVFGFFWSKVLRKCKEVLCTPLELE